jgi:iron complex transport system permease protein
MKPPIPYPLLVLGLVALAALLFLASMLIGVAGTGTSDLIGLMGRGQSDLAWLIMREVRLPRTALALMEGATLGLAGAVLQGLLRNPLADPAVVGVSSGASLFAVFAFYTGIATAFPLALPLFAILGALICVLLLLGLAGRGGMLTLILAGVAIAHLSGSLSQLIMNLSKNPYAATEIMFWLMGSVTDRSLDHLWLAAPFMVVGWLVLLSRGRALDALSLGDEAAASLGVDLPRTRLILVIGAAISVGAGSAVTGGIGFIGLVVPHLLRPLVGHKPSRLLLVSLLGGACLLVAADILVRLIVVGPAGELKLGVVTALIGAPFFLWLIFRARKELES